MKVRIIIEDTINKVELEQFIFQLRDLKGEFDWSIECNTKTHVQTNGTSYMIKAD